MDIKSSFTYDSKIANDVYAAKASAAAKENRLATGQKVSEPSSDAASLPEVLGKAASYFHLGDKAELKEKMCQGIRQECGDVTVEEIRKRVDRFQWRKSARVIYRVIRKEKGRYGGIFKSGKRKV